MSLLPLLWIALASGGEPRWEPVNQATVEVYNRGVTALNSGDPVGAEQYLHKALRRDPDCGMCSATLATSLLYQDRSPEAYAKLSELTERFPDELSLARVLAEAAFAMERFDESIQIAERLLLADPEQIDSLRLLAQGLLRVGDTARARAAIQQASAHHDPEILACELGKVALEEGYLDEARQQLELCRQADNPGALAALESRILSVEGRFGEAEASLIEGADPAVSTVLTARRFMQKEDFEAAAKILRQAEKEDPRAGERVVLLGLCEARLGRPEQALAALEQAFSGDTWVSVSRLGGVSGILTASGEQGFIQQVREAVVRLVMLQIELTSVEDARVTLERARKEMEPCGDLRVAELWILMAEQHFEEAAAVAVDGMERFPDSAVLRDAADLLGTNHPQARTPALEAALVAGGDWSALFNAATDQHNAGDYSGCLARLDAAPRFEDAEGSLRIAKMAYRCAALIPDLVASDRWLETVGGPQLVDASAVINHAGLLQRSGQDDRALALLSAVIVPDGEVELATSLRSVELDIHLQREAVDEALAVLARGPVQDPVRRYNTAVLLINAGRYGDAVPLLRSTCPQIADPAECQVMLERVLEAMEP